MVAWSESKFLGLSMNHFAHYHFTFSAAGSNILFYTTVLWINDNIMNEELLYCCVALLQPCFWAWSTVCIYLTFIYSPHVDFQII
jgi:hypothetical protein